MKLREYIENLNQFATENPEALDMDVITSIDDEGNGFTHVHYAPSKGIFSYNEFISHSQIAERGRDESEVNAVCVN